MYSGHFLFYFFNFINYSALSFIICFDLFYIRLSQPYNPSHEFGTRVFL